MVYLPPIPVGIFYVSITVVLVVPYVFNLVVITTRKTLLKMPCYKILLAIGISDIIQVFLIGLVPAFFCFFGADGTGTTEKVFGAILLGAWYISTSATAVLSINRFLIFTNEYYSDMCFGHRRVYVWILCCCLYGIAHCCIFLSPQANYMFNTDYYMWYYENSTFTMGLMIYNIANDVATMSISVGLQAVVLVHIWRLMKMAGILNFKPEEKYALVPALISSSTLVFSDLCDYVLPVISEDFWVLFSLDIAWIAMVGMNGVLNLLLNRSVRKHALKMLGIRSNSVNNNNNFVHVNNNIHNS